MVWPLLGLSYGAPFKVRFHLEVSANLGVSYPIRIASYLAPRQLQTSSCHRGEIHEVVWHDGFLGRTVGCSVICLDRFGASYSLFYCPITHMPHHTFFFSSYVTNPFEWRFEVIIFQTTRNEIWELLLPPSRLRVDGISHAVLFFKTRTFNAFIVNEGPALWRSCLESPGELNQNHFRTHMNPLWKRYTYNFHVAKGSRIYVQFVFVICLLIPDESQGFLALIRRCSRWITCAKRKPEAFKLVSSHS